MALDPSYILQQDIDSYFVDKATGLPLANGEVYFYEDNNRNSLKSVYQLTGAPPNYTFTALPNPIILNGAGSYDDGAGNNIAIYFKPYDDSGNIELYYVAVFASGDGPAGVPQLSREAWPNTTSANSPTNSAEGSFVNMLSNPEFADINWDPTQTLTLTIAGIVTNQDYDIAPAWKLRVTTTGAATITVTRENITGTQQQQENPAYVLNVTGGANVSSLLLIQRLYNDSNVWSATDNNLAGYVASTITLGPQANSAITMTYAPSNGVAQQLLNVTNTTATYKTFYETVQLTAANNSDNSYVGYVDIILTLPTSSLIRFSTVQCIAMATEALNVPYDQAPVNRQRDYLAHYYKPMLAYKPIPSYLVGWDFPRNPAQIHGDTWAVQAIGANKSQYVWDQTIAFQSVDSGFSFARANNGGFQVTCAQIGQVAIIQYLDQVEARKILNDRMSVHIDGYTSLVAGIRGTVSLWATTDANLPNCATATNNSIVLTMGATGTVATRNGTWTPVTRLLGDATFTLPAASTTNDNTADINLSGWDMVGVAPTNTATYFAIVIGFAPMAIADVITLSSVSLCAGDMATRPAPKQLDETLRDCERYYEKSYKSSDAIVGVAGPVTNIGALTAPMLCGYIEGGGPYTARFIENSFGFNLRTLKRTLNSTVSLYSPITGTAGRVSATAAGGANTVFDDVLATYWNAPTIGDKYIAYISSAATPSATPYTLKNVNTPLTNWITYHYVVDARLGIVN